MGNQSRPHQSRRISRACSTTVRLTPRLHRGLRLPYDCPAKLKSCAVVTRCNSREPRKKTTRVRSPPTQWTVITGPNPLGSVRSNLVSSIAEIWDYDYD